MGTTTIVVGGTYQPELLDFAARLIALPGRFGPHARAIGKQRDGAIIAVAVFDNFEPWGCEVSFAVSERHWFCHDYARTVFAYPFLKLQYERLTCRTAVHNRPARILAHALGFKYEGRQRRADPDEDRLMFGMLRTECRWLKER